MSVFNNVDVTLNQSGQLYLKKSVSYLGSCINSNKFTVIASCWQYGQTAVADTLGAVFIFDCERNNWQRLRLKNRVSISGLCFLNRGRSIGICLVDGKCLIHRLIDSFTQYYRTFTIRSSSFWHNTSIVCDTINSDIFCTWSASKIILWVANQETYRQHRVLSSTKDHGEFIDVKLFEGRIYVLYCRIIFVWTIPDFQFCFKIEIGKEYSDLLRMSVNQDFIVAGGDSIFIWNNLTEPTLASVIDIPKSATSVLEIHILKKYQSKILLLGDDGRCLLLNNNVDSCAVDVDIGTLSKKMKQCSGFRLDNQDKYLILLNLDQTMACFLDLKLYFRGGKVPSLEKGIIPNSDVVNVRLSPQQIRLFLLSHREFPTNYRHIIWRFLLGLPQDEERFANYLKKGPHPSCSELSSRYPLRDSRLARKLSLLLSALAHWSPLCAELEHLPATVFPFMVFFGSDDLATFETTVVFLTQLQTGFLCSFPHPPIPLLAGIDSVLALHDLDLANRLIKLGVGPQVYAWPMLRTSFTEVLDKKDWLCLLDHIFAWHQQPFVLLLAAIALILAQRTKLMGMKRSSDVEDWVHEEHCGDIQGVVGILHKLKQDQPTCSLFTKIALELPDGVKAKGGEYPQLQGYPKFALDFQQQERNRLAEEEAHLKHKNKMVEEMTKRMNDMEVQERLWRQTQQVVGEVDEARQKQIRFAHDKALAQASSVHVNHQNLRLKRVLDREIAVGASINWSNQTRSHMSQRIADELKWAQQREETMTSVLAEEEHTNKAINSVLSRIDVVEKELKRENEAQALQFAAMREREAAMIAERNLLSRWEVEDVELDTVRDDPEDRFKQKPVFIAGSILKDRGSRMKVVDKLRMERKMKADELSMLLAEDSDP